MKIENFLKNSLNMEIEARAASEALGELAHRRAETTSSEGGLLMEAYAQDLTFIEEKHMTLIKMLSALPDPATKQIFVCRYIHKLSWEDTAEAVNFSLSQAQRVHKKGLDWLENNYDF